MVRFSTQEMVLMVFILGECEKNCLLASRVYAARYPDAEKKPRPEAFQSLMERFVETGNVAYLKRKVVNRTVTNEENEMAVLLRIQENPNVNASNISNDMEISERSVGRILKKYKYHPYHIELHQELYENDFENRLLYCMRTIDNQNRWSVNVWGGILGPYIIGPYFFEERLTGEVYLNFLQRELPNLIQHVDALTLRTLWYQHDGAPPHFHQAVRNFLNEWKTERWIGRGGPIAWPPRSPDLTPLDFYLWGYVKGEVYAIAPTSAENMKERIRVAFRNVRDETLLSVQQNYLRRLQLCVQHQGRIFEHFI